jgi:hypothetical protein
MKNENDTKREFDEYMRKWSKAAEERWGGMTEAERKSEEEKWQSAQSQLAKLLGF